jgi:hypothetical protein
MHHAVSIHMKSFVNPIETSDSAGNPTTSFEVNSFSINPQNAAIFPEYVSHLATSYQYYQISNLMVRVDPLTAPADRGQLQYAFLHDPTTPIPSSQRDMLNIAGSQAQSGWEPDQHYEFGRVDQINWLSVGTGYNLSINDQSELNADDRIGGTNERDPRFETAGTLLIATVGYSDTAPSVVANMSISYSITFLGLHIVDTNDSAAIRLINPSNTFAATEAAWVEMPGTLPVTVSAQPASGGFCLRIGKPGVYAVEFQAYGSGFGAALSRFVQRNGAFLPTPLSQTAQIAFPYNSPTQGWNFNDVTLAQTIFLKVIDINYAFDLALSSANISTGAVEIRVTRLPELGNTGLRVITGTPPYVTDAVWENVPEHFEKWTG